MDVGSWLRSLGLEQYEALFRENDIDAELLGDLTDADLEKLGVTLGHRKRLLKAIAGLKSTHDEPGAGNQRHSSGLPAGAHSCPPCQH
jgi:SAM domain (Sterile alpha motif)